MTRPLFDSEYIFGIHEPGGEQHIAEMGRTGWVLFTRALSNPDDFSMSDFSQWSDQGLGVSCRLNHGYEPVGTIPSSAHYDDFAQRCAEFVAASKGCKLWIIGNEMNLPVERPEVGTTRALGPQAMPRLPHPLREQLRSAEDRGAMLQPQPISTPTPEIETQATPLPHAAGQISGQIFGQNVGQIINGREVITPWLYADCYLRCRAAIHAVAGHSNDQVLIGSVAPWNNETSYGSNRDGDWVDYLKDILNEVGVGNCDGITLHAYTHSADPNLITANVPMGSPFQKRQFEFKVYQDFMRAIPTGMRHLPVYITETDQVKPWLDANIGWVQAAYAEINWWNSQPGNQQIRALILYRWPNIDPWVIEGKQGVIMDFRAALQNDYRWRLILPPPLALRNGDSVQTIDLLNLRKSAGFNNKPTDDVIQLLQPASQLTVIGNNAAQVDGLVWWQVEFIKSDDLRQRGWVAQFSATGSPLIEKSRGKNTGRSEHLDGTTPVTAAISTGSRVATRDFVRVRKSAGFVGKTGEDTLSVLPAGSELVVSAGPAQKDGLTWWRVQGSKPEGGTLDGWAAERSPADVLLLQLLPTPMAAMAFPSAAPRPATATTLDFVRVRKTPGFAGKPNDDVIGQLDPNVEVELLADPVLKDGLRWWQIVAPNGVIGWAADKSPADVQLLKIAVNVTIPPSDPGFRRGDLVQTATRVRLRRSAGTGGSANDVLGEFLPNATLNIIDGPLSANEMQWWRVGGILAGGGEAIGYVAEKLVDGTALIQYALPLPGSSIPNRQRGIFLNLPFQGSFGIAQLWGENPQIYSQITYDGVPLLGHNGIDFLTPTGTPLVAVDHGVVAEAVMNDPTGFGNYVKLQHDWGESLYAHLLGFSVVAGQSLVRGQTIGQSNNSGFSQGPHLHFSIRIGTYDRKDGWGGFSDPLPYFDPNDIQMPAYVQPFTPTRGVESVPTTNVQLPGIGYAPDQPNLRRP